MIVLNVDRLNAYAVGVALSCGVKHLVPGTLPGEEVEVALVSKRKDAVWCELVRVLKPSPQRIIPPCPHFGACGGCDLQHASYAEQLRWKTGRVRELFGRYPGVRIRDTIPALHPYGYRNRVTLHHDGRTCGFHRANSRELVPIRSCPLASDAVNAKIAGLGNEFLSGPASFEVREDEGNAFVQVNSHQNEALIAEVLSLSHANKSHRILELYAGSGNLTFPLAALCRELIAVEGNLIAVNAANRARRELAAKNVSFRREAAYDAVFHLVQDCASFDVIVCDPPREGLKECAALLPRLSPRRIVCVSCEPKSLVKDAPALENRAYRLSEVVPIDMFPQTRHVEIVALFEKT